MTSYLSAVATYKPTECITGVDGIGLYGMDTDFHITTDGKVRARGDPLLNPPFRFPDRVSPSGKAAPDAER
jgi:hypothetical protein